MIGIFILLTFFCTAELQPPQKTTKGRDLVVYGGGFEMRKKGEETINVDKNAVNVENFHVEKSSKVCARFRGHTARVQASRRFMCLV